MEPWDSNAVREEDLVGGDRLLMGVLDRLLHEGRAHDAVQLMQRVLLEAKVDRFELRVLWSMNLYWMGRFTEEGC